MRLFLYGTLQPGAQTPMARWLAERTTAAHRASIPGQLVTIATPQGWYPALVRGRAGERCRGTLVRADLHRCDLTRLDRYEGREYRRVAVRVRGAQATAVALTYVWSGARPAGALPVAGGDFLAWIAQTGHRTYREGCGPALTARGAPAIARRHDREQARRPDHPQSALWPRQGQDLACRAAGPGG